MATNTPLTLSNLQVDFQDFVSQFQSYLTTKESWKGFLTTLTGQTLLEFLAANGALDQLKIDRYYEDSFPETALNDQAILAIAIMQGVRINRKFPSAIRVDISSPVPVIIPPYTQFTAASTYFFNRDSIQLDGMSTLNVELYQGYMVEREVRGLGTPFQAFVSNEAGFTVSDSDVRVAINGSVIPKTFAGLWLMKGTEGCLDTTLRDGRLLVQFGNDLYGSNPSVNDVCRITYPITSGLSSNNLITLGKKLNTTIFPQVTGIITTNPTGGADEKSVLTYKNIAAPTFGTFGSAVTKNQYKGSVLSYPGVVDAITFAQREINPFALEWMNVIKIVALTTSPWTQQQKEDFITYMQDSSMYSPRFFLEDPVPVDRNLSLNIYCYNTALLEEVRVKIEASIQRLFSAKPGILTYDIFLSDIITTVKEADPGVEYIDIVAPETDLIVSSASPPQLTGEALPTGGDLSNPQYAYGISVTTAFGDSTPSNWVFVDSVGPTTSVKLVFNTVGNATKYNIWGRDQNGTLGKIAEKLPEDAVGGFITFIDDGSATPVGPLPSQSTIPVLYNRLANLSISMFYSMRQYRPN